MGISNNSGITLIDGAEWGAIKGNILNQTDLINYIGSAGFGTVANVSGTDANGVVFYITNPSTTPNITISLGAITPTSVAASGTVTGANLSGTNTGDQTNITGNAGTATTLQTARNINGVSFNGTADITVTAAAGTLTGATLASNVLASSLTSVGTLSSLTLGGTLAMGANNITSTGSLGATGARLTKGWFTDLEVTNAIVGSITGNAATATLATTATNGTVANEATDTTCFPLFATDATGDLPFKSNANLTYDSSAGIFFSTKGFYGTVKTAITAGGVSNQGMQLSASGAAAKMLIGRFSNDTNAPALFTVKSRNTTAGSFTIVQNADPIWEHRCLADNGTNYSIAPVLIQAIMDDTVTSSAMGGKYVISTITAGTTTSAVERLVVNSSGNVGIGTTGITVAARNHIVATTEQVRIGYDSSNYYSTTVSSTGGVTFNAVGSGSSFAFSDKVTVPRGGAATAARVGGSIFDYFTDVSVGGAEADIYSATLDVSLFATDGDKVTASYGGNFVTGGTELTQLKAKLAGTTIWDSTGVAPTTGTTSWRVYVELIRVSSTVIRYTVSLQTTGATGYVYCSVGELTGLTLTNTNILKITGTSTGVGSGAGDIVGKMGFVEYKPYA